MAYGKRIKSEFAFDALPIASSDDGAILIQVQRLQTIEKDTGLSVRPCTAQNRSIHIVSHDSYVAVQIDLIFGFELWLTSNRIQCFVQNEISDDLLRYWLLQQILPLFFLLNGSMEFLHGMAVSTLPGPELSASPPSCMGFLGESYAGKSTLLSYFLSRNHALVTDDHLALTRHNYTQVLPATPFYRPYRAAEDLGVRAASYSSEPTELRYLYLLTPASSDSDVRAERLTGMDAITTLFPNIHYSLHNSEKPDFFPLVEDRFRGLADLARRIPFARLHVPRSLERLPEVYDFIQNDLTSALPS
jgi:hypothetical protein